MNSRDEIPSFKSQNLKGLIINNLRLKVVVVNPTNPTEITLL